ncbi:GNAT family N-acetyltransferase, partial [Mycobacterium tuberculosis]|nr:GNAT family N-acetyltransferase [Mycobacterium tuberculosis]
TRDVKEVAPYRKAYEVEADLFSSDREHDDYLIAVAKAGDRVRGYLLASRGWNNYAQVDDLAVDRDVRKLGVGRGLMDEAVRWA